MYKWLTYLIKNFGKVNSMVWFLNEININQLNINQLKLKVHDTYKKDEKITTNFEPIDNVDVVNKGYLDEKMLKLNGYLSKLEKDYNEFKLQYNKQSIEDILVQRAVKTTIKILYDKGLIDNYASADKVL